MAAVLNVLAISGSLRAHSSNTEVLRASAIVAPPSVRIRIFDGLADLPYFNPDLDGEGAVAPASVAQFRAEIQAADAVLISSPEYAHGVPGVLKNALDWLVSVPGMMFKPVAVLNIFRRSAYARASLLETLRTMSSVPILFELSLASRAQTAQELAADPEIANALRLALDELMSASKLYRQRMASL